MESAISVLCAPSLISGSEARFFLPLSLVPKKRLLMSYTLKRTLNADGGSLHQGQQTSLQDADNKESGFRWPN